MYAVIIAGGRGTRFWPASRKNKPKQLLNIIGDHSMLQMTVDRLRKMKNVEDIFIITGEHLKDSIQSSISGIKTKNIIVEPKGKNTAPAIGLAALHVKQKRPDAVMGVFPADHLIVGAQKFAKTVRSGIQIASKNPTLITIGIDPHFPATGYGYIQYNSKSPYKHLNAFPVKTFAEKPHQKLAERFIKSGDFLWNGGMFIWSVETFFTELNTHMPELNKQLKKIEQRISSKKDFSRLWNNIEAQSIDYGLLEKTNNIHVVKAEFDWNDLGSWNSLFDVSPKTEENNVVRGHGLIIDGKNNLIESQNKFTAVIGQNDLVVVNTDDATLVIPKDRVEEVKAIIQYLEEIKRKDLL
tara:strand:+ start:1507 stop:2565 length:1059 start_codon:yes stop_codon:yes gene_type:complete